MILGNDPAVPSESSVLATVEDCIELEGCPPGFTFFHFALVGVVAIDTAREQCCGPVEGQLVEESAELCSAL